MTSKRLRNLQCKMDNTDSYEQWQKSAAEFDRLSGMSDWQRRQTSTLYDHQLVRSRLNRLRDERQHSNDLALLYVLNEGIHGNLGGMGKSVLYQKAHVGTKQLINDFIDEVVFSLQHIAKSSHPKISFAEKVDFFRRASHCYGRSALMLSGGATQGIFHIGVLKALFEEHLLPTVVSGSSAGSIMAAILATHTDNELEELLGQENLRVESMKFVGWSKLFKGVPLMDSQHLEETLSEYVPDITFEEAYLKTNRKVSISISPAKRQHESRLLNAVSSPNVFIRRGVMASCAVPGIFKPVTLTAKNFEGDPQPYNPSRQWVDGTITNDLPAKRLSRIYGVNHYIASQINPHVVPFVSERGARKTYHRLAGDFCLSTAKQFLSKILDEGRYRISSPTLGLAITQIHALLAQDYSADIIIHPNRRFINPFKLFTDPTDEEVENLMLEGEKATWPKMEMIRNCTKISRALDLILEDLEKEEKSRLEH